MVTIPSLTGNLSIPCIVDGTAWMAEIPGLPMMPLYSEDDLITMKFIHDVTECTSLPTVVSSRICPIGDVFSPAKLISDAFVGLNCF